MVDNGSEELAGYGPDDVSSENLLAEFWENTGRQIAELNPADMRETQELPLARIKKIMKLDEDVKMISAEAPVLFAKAAEIFIRELTLRAWMNTEENKRRTLQRNDVAMAITKSDQYDFLIDIVPREETVPPPRPRPTNSSTAKLLRYQATGSAVPAAPTVGGHAARLAHVTQRSLEKVYTVSVPNELAPPVDNIDDDGLTLATSTAVAASSASSSSSRRRSNSRSTPPAASQTSQQPIIIQIAQPNQVQTASSQTVQIVGANNGQQPQQQQQQLLQIGNNQLIPIPAGAQVLQLSTPAGTGQQLRTQGQAQLVQLDQGSVPQVLQMVPVSRASTSAGTVSQPQQYQIVQLPANSTVLQRSADS